MPTVLTYDDLLRIASDLKCDCELSIPTFVLFFYVFLLSLSFFTSSFLTYSHSLSFLLTPLTVLVVILLGSLPYQG